MIQLGRHQLHHGDALDVLRAMPEASVDAVVTDPPYGIGFMGKKWDTPGALVERQADKSQRWDHIGGNHNPTSSADSARTRQVEGRKFQSWCEAWARECLRVLVPGGHIVAFSATRMYHRLAAGVEDAGFEVRDCLAWLFGSGFPKHPSVLKPAYEPILLCRKPLAGTVAANVQEYGTGALNIEACRIAADSTKRTNAAEMGYGGGNTSTAYETGSEIGRWPANVVLDEEAGAALDAQTGDLGKSAGVQRNSPANKIYGRGLSGHPERDGMPLGFGDTGGASRFFYCAKASTSERGATNKHPTVKPLALMRWLCQLVTPPGGVILDPFAGSGTTLLAADALGFTCLAVECEAEHVDIITDRYRAVAPLFVEAA